MATPSTVSRAPVRERRRHPGKLEAALASFAHEVRTPLNGILVFADLLAASDLPAREREWASAVKSAAEHLSHLTTIVVDGARDKALVLRPQRFDLHALLASVRASLHARAAAKGLSSECQFAPALPRWVIGDGVRLRAAIENLIDNAVKFTAHGRVAFSADWRDGKVSLAVTDSGIGLSRAELRRLFRPFTQANARIAQQFGGAGLGLAFACSVARAMNGTLTADSAPGQGSTFRLSVPLEPADGGAAEEAQRVAGGSARRLLCAEDNPYGRIVLRTITEALGHTVTFVGSGEAVLQALEAEAFDAVVLDIQLPGIDGIETTRRIRDLAAPRGATPVIGLSGHDEPRIQNDARAAGMQAFLVKPVTPAAFAAALASVSPAPFRTQPQPRGGAGR